MKQVIKKKIVEAHKINTEDNEYVLVVDGSSVLKTSLVANKTNEDGKDYGGVMTFFKLIRDVITLRDFKHCYVFFDDNKSGQLRANLYPLYKANRDKHYDMSNMTDYDKAISDYVKKVLAYSREKKKNQDVVRGETDDERYQRERDIILQICEELYIRTYMSEYVEADDLCAYVVKNKKPNQKIVVISGDRDLTQLIADDVCVYVLQMRKYITPQNCVEELGYTHENVVLKKILCGDASDNIKGVKGLGEQTFFNLFPDAKTRLLTLDDIIQGAKEINEQRAKNKKKPLQVCTNIIEGITDGIQGKKLYEINEKIISLEKPLLTEEAENFMKDFIVSPLDQDGRKYENLYKIAKDNKMHALLDGDKLGTFFGAFNRLVENEKKYQGED